MEEGRDIVDPLTERGDAEHDAVETIEEILAEATVGDSLLQFDISSGDDTDVSLLDNTRADPHILTLLEDAEQLCLSSERKFANLVEEDSATIGLLEVTTTFAEGTSEGTLLVAEEFGVDSTFRNSTTVDSDIRLMLTGAEGVDNLREDLLTATALADNEDGEVDRSYGGSGLNSMIEFCVVTNDTEPRLYFSDIHVKESTTLTDKSNAKEGE